MSGVPNKHTIKNWLKVIIPLVLVIVVGFLAYRFNTHEVPEEPTYTPKAPIHVEHERKQTTTFEYLPKTIILLLEFVRIPMYNSRLNNSHL